MAPQSSSCSNTDNTGNKKSLREYFDGGCGHNLCDHKMDETPSMSDDAEQLLISVLGSSFASLGDSSWADAELDSIFDMTIQSPAARFVSHDKNHGSDPTTKNLISSSLASSMSQLECDSLNSLATNSLTTTKVHVNYGLSSSSSRPQVSPRKIQSMCPSTRRIEKKHGHVSNGLEGKTISWQTKQQKGLGRRSKSNDAMKPMPYHSESMAGRSISSTFYPFDERSEEWANLQHVKDDFSDTRRPRCLDSLQRLSKQKGQRTRPRLNRTASMPMMSHGPHNIVLADGTDKSLDSWQYKQQRHTSQKLNDMQATGNDDPKSRFALSRALQSFRKLPVSVKKSNLKTLLTSAVNVVEGKSTTEASRQ